MNGVVRSPLLAITQENLYFKEYLPDPFFSRFIDSYFTIDTNLVNENITDLIVPDGTFGMLFIDQGRGIGRNTRTDHPPITLRRTSIFGQKTKPVNYYYTPGKVQSFGVKINPEGLALFLNLSVKDFNNRFFEICDLGDRELLDLESQVMDQHGVEEKIQMVETFLLRRFTGLNTNEDYLLFSSMVSHIKLVRGEIRSDMLSEKFNVNYKKVERLFKFFLGINPKTYIRIIRFNAAIHVRSEREELNLTQLGYELGFYDQSHFIREFKTFSSLTPKAFFGKERSHSERINLQVIAQRFKNKPEASAGRPLKITCR